MTFNDFLWNDSYLLVQVVMPSGRAEYNSTLSVYMRASHLRTLIYDMKLLGSEQYNVHNMNYGPVRIITDYDAAILMQNAMKRL